MIEKLRMWQQSENAGLEQKPEGYGGVSPMTEFRTACRELQKLCRDEK